jgi:hypothetical protein
VLMTVGAVAAMAAGRGTVAVEPLRALRES